MFSLEGAGQALISIYTVAWSHTTGEGVEQTLYSKVSFPAKPGFGVYKKYHWH
jgi:hypothetical protein